MDQDEVWTVIGSERRSLADLLEGLEPAALATPSLCDAWTVLGVGAHLTLSPLSRPRDVLLAFARARGDFDRAVAIATESVLDHPVEQVVHDLRRTSTMRTHPLGTTYREPLTDVLVHGQDIAVPLGLEREMPVAAAAFAARRVWTAIFPFFPQRRLTGLQLVADDSDLRVGRGAPVHGRTQDLLLLLTGRYARVDRLSGEGSAVLAERVRV